MSPKQITKARLIKDLKSKKEHKIVEFILACYDELYDRFPADQTLTLLSQLTYAYRAHRIIPEQETIITQS